MTAFNGRRRLLLLGVSAFLGGCSVVSGWFPDKQKQYQYSTEIPPLEIPPDLTASTIEGAATRPGASRTYEEPPAPADGEGIGERSGESQSAAEDEQPRPAARRSGSKSPPTLAQSSNDVPLIELQGPFEIAWAEVAKALGRLELEISDQNRSDGIFYVYYGGDRKPYEDRGFFGDVAEMFGKGQEQSKEYRIKLEQKEKSTLVYVLDPDNKPQTSGPGFELLKRLHEALQSASAKGGGTPAPGE